MDEFERQLEQALRRVEAPRGFAERVCALSAEEPVAARKVLPWRSRQRWVGGALAAGLALAALGGEGWHVHRVAQRRVVAEAQFATAMRVTDRAMEKTRMQLSRAGVRLFND